MLIFTSDPPSIMSLSVENRFVLHDLFHMAEHQDQIPWTPFREGIEVHWIYKEAGEGPSAALLRFQPGAKVAWHEHGGFEHILVLSGSQADEHGGVSAGSLMVHRPGSGHSITSEEGCIVLAIYEKPVRFL